jgi:hypothetical protein
VEVDVVSFTAEFPNDNPALHRGVSWVCLEVTGACVAIREAPPVLAAPEHVPVPVPVDVHEEDGSTATVTATDVSESAEIPESRISGVVPVGEIQHVDASEEEDEEILVEELPPLDESASIEGVLEAVPSDAIATEILASIAPEPATELPPASDDPFMTLVSTLVDIALAAGSPHVASVLPALLLEGRIAHALADDALQALAEANIANGTEVTPAFVAQTHAWRAILRGTSDDFAACGNAMLDEWAAELLARLLGASSRAATLRRELRSHGVAAFGLVEAA